jgi:hemerythrin-like domain-containing protein
MNGSQTFQSITREALEEHRQIHFFLDQVSRTLESMREELTDVEPMRRLGAQIEALKERLVEHHQIEERGGLFQVVLELLPERRVEIDRLIGEHDRMIEILEMARLHAQGGEATDADALRVDLEGFLEMFREHERAEDQLLLLAMERETKTLG